jgi:hypothetical protein
MVLDITICLVLEPTCLFLLKNIAPVLSSAMMLSLIMCATSLSRLVMKVVSFKPSDIATYLASVLDTVTIDWRYDNQITMHNPPIVPIYALVDFCVSGLSPNELSTTS